MSELGIWEYIRDLRRKYKLYHNKQVKFLSHICIYTHKLTVYKVIIWADPNKKNGYRRGVTEMIKIYDKNNNEKGIPFPKLKKELDGSEIGNKVFIYYPKTEVLNCFEGEDTIESAVHMF